LAPLKALKASSGSSAHWVAEAQAAIQRGAASARADPKEPATQGGAAEATPTQTGEGAPLPHEGEARESDGAEVPAVAEATEVEALRVSEAKATAEAAVAEVEAPTTIEATMAGAGAPGTTEADVIMARPSAQEVEMKAAEASVAPLVQGPLSLRESAREVEVLPISSDNVSQAWEMADGEVAGAVEQLVPTPGEGSSALAWVRPEPRGWDYPRVLWQSWDDPEVEPLFALEDAAEASAAVQAVLETEIGEHDALKSAARTACEALEVEGVQSGRSLRSRLVTLSGQV